MPSSNPPLNISEPLRRTNFNRVFAAAYLCAILTLFYHHITKIINSTSAASLFLSLLLLISDAVLALQWANAQSFRIRPICRREFPENLEKIIRESEFPAVDVFICTADPFKEPPVVVVNSALSVMAYDYPPEKISVYVSDDGGSVFTLFAFMEAAKFARYWLPFCKENNVLERAPEAYFRSNCSCSSETEKIKNMYEEMKGRIENVLEKGKIEDGYIDNEENHEALRKWANNFTSQDHPAVIEVLLAAGKDGDCFGHWMPNLVYVAREKSRTKSHHFKAGALNTLIRVSATMTNAPIILTLDCDMYSNDPQTPWRALCYLTDAEICPGLAYIQFPQTFPGLDRDDIYACERKDMYHVNPMGLDGFRGPDYFGTGSFFQRRALFGSPSSFIEPEIDELRPVHIVKKPIQCEEILALAHKVAGCSYENNSEWGSKLGFRYGSLVEDFYTGLRLHGEGWRSIFCHPDRPAFLADAPATLFDLLNQSKRWDIGLLEVLFSKYNPLVFGVRSIGFFMGLGYGYYACGPIWAIPISVYAFIPQLALLNRIPIFPKVLDPIFFLYMFMFMGAYAQDLLEFTMANGTVHRWWNDQRMWMISGLSSNLFACFEYSLKSLGVAMPGFGVTTKVQEADLMERYSKGIFEFGVASPLFIPMTMAAVINLTALVMGVWGILRSGLRDEGLMLPILLSGFVTVNCLPIYEAMVVRSDGGRMPARMTMISLVLVLFMIGGVVLG